MVRIKREHKRTLRSQEKKFKKEITDLNNSYEKRLAKLQKGHENKMKQTIERYLTRIREATI